jgi:hypothetical protein
VRPFKKPLLGVIIAFLVLFFGWVIYWGITPKSISLIVDIHKITPVSPLYYIKTGRESLQSLFVFGDQDLSFWDFTLAQKRLEEAQALQSYSLKKPTQMQIDLAKKYQQEGITHLNRLIDKIDVNYLIKLRDDNKRKLSKIIG